MEKPGAENSDNNEHLLYFFVNKFCFLKCGKMA